MKKTEFKHYTESIFYEIELTGKYIKLMANNFFRSTNIDIAPEEYIALDIILANPGICQIDLAKLMLKDRSNTGRIANSAELKGLLERFTDKKGNRTVKKMKITEKGKHILNLARKAMLPAIAEIEKKFDDKEKEKLKNSLTKLKTVLSETITTNI